MRCLVNPSDWGHPEITKPLIVVVPSAAAPAEACHCEWLLGELHMPVLLCYGINWLMVLCGRVKMQRYAGARRTGSGGASPNERVRCSSGAQAADVLPPVSLGCRCTVAFCPYSATIGGLFC